ncbi:unnamed protein product [Orchesella dallaii]|uniref:Uncharacterized protein n=1 Tax=Orchesella dallaii TaxID=48710 RepID=A0ABP1RGJ0_9HEXA
MYLQLKYFLLQILLTLPFQAHCTYQAEELVFPKETFEEVTSSRIYSQFRNNVGRSFQFQNSIIQNLHEMVDELPSCLNHIINYNGMDLIPFKNPIVLSRYDVIHVKYKVKRPWTRKTADGLFTDWKRSLYFEKVSKLLANKTQQLPWCKRVSLWDDMECYDVELVDNSPKINGWSCESHWYLFPPNPTEDMLFYEKNLGGLRMLIPGSYKSFWSHKVGRVMNESNLGEFRAGLLKTRPIYDIIITKMNQVDYYTMRAWTKSLYAAHNGLPKGYTTSAREELTFTIEISNSLKNLAQKIYLLKNAILFCRHCKRALPFQPIALGVPFCERELIATFLNLNSNTDYIYWTLWMVGGLDDGFLSQDLKEMLNVSPYSYLLSTGEEHNKLWSNLDLAQFQVEVRILMQTVVGSNGSFRYENWWGINWKSSDWHGTVPLETKYNSPFVLAGLYGNGDLFQFAMHPTKLKFVSCGKPLQDGLAFAQLLSIFDIPTWLGVAGSTIIVTFMLRKSSSRSIGGDSFTKYLGLKKSNLNHQKGIIYPSELYLYAIGAKDSMFQMYNDHYILPETLDRIVNRSVLHPLWVTIFTNRTPTNIEILVECNKTSLFLPELEAIETYYKLRQNKTIRNNVYLSTNDLFSLNHRIQFVRWVNPKIIRRMNGLDASGIWRWWSNIVMNYLTKVRGRESGLNDGQVRGTGESNLGGNISIVFALLAAGIASCLAFFVYEIRRLIKKTLGRVYQFVRKQVRKYFR